MALQGHAPQSISNTISHLRTYFQLAGLAPTPLHHHRVGLALRAISTTIRHFPAPRLPVTPELLTRALSSAHHAQSPEATHLALLLMFMGFLRQSSVAPPSVATYDHTRHLAAKDLRLAEQGLHLNIKWTKTIQSSADATSLILPPTANKALCPVTAYQAYCGAAPPPRTPLSPLLRHQDGNTLTVPFIRRQWAHLVTSIGEDPAQFSLHSLRKGAADYTYNVARADLNDVMTYGTWRSQAVRAYIRPPQGPQNSVYQALNKL